MDLGAMLKGKGVLVTGASGGLGAHFAQVAARHGARVVIGARRKGKLDALAAELKALGAHSVLAIDMDVGDDASIRAAFEAIDAAHDGIDALCRIIDDDGQLVRVLTIGTQEDKVADLALKILAMLALNTIEKDELAIRHAQAPRAGRTAFRQTRPTKPWVEQTTIDRQMIGRRGNFAARAGTRVDVAIELQTDERRVVDIEPPALNQDFSVPLEAESIQRAQDGIGGTRHRARPINVLDAHQPFAAMCPRIEITADGGDE